MLNKLHQSKKQNNVSKFFKSVALTGGMLLFILKPGISKGNEDLKAELQKVLKEHSVTEWKIQESKQDDSKTYHMDKIQQKMDSVAPDTTTIKNFFLNGGFLTPAEVTDFNSMRKESVKSPSRPATYLTICDIRKTAKDDYEKSVLITTFLDPFQKTELGKLGFKTVETDGSLKRIFSACCKIHTQNIETIKLEKESKKLDEENKNLDEAIKLLQQLEDIYKKYLNN